MKRTIFAFVLLVLLSFNLSAQQVTFTAQSLESDIYVVNLSFTADSAATTFYSTGFTLPAGFSAEDFTTNKITAYYDLNTASGNPKTIVGIYGQAIGTAKTVLDSLGIGTGVGDTLVSGTANKCFLTLNGYKSDTYYIGITQIATGKALTTSYVKLVFIKPKE